MDYKDLHVWKKNQSCLKHTVVLFKELPRDRATNILFGQVFRSLSSIGANIAEGSGSYIGGDFPRYLNIALRSVFESDHWFETLKNLYTSKVRDIENIRIENHETLKMLIALSKSIQNKRKKH